MVYSQRFGQQAFFERVRALSLKTAFWPKCRDYTIYLCAVFILILLYLSLYEAEKKTENQNASRKEYKKSNIHIVRKLANIEEGKQTRNKEEFGEVLRQGSSEVKCKNSDY